MIQAKFFIQIAMILLSGICMAQDQLAIGQWRAHLPTGRGQTITMTSSQIFIGTESAMYAYDWDENSFQNFSKVNGLSDINVKKVKYDPETDFLLIIYDNLNMDLYRNGVFTNVPSIMNSQIFGSKQVNEITFYQGKAFISADFGLIELDLESANILNTYKLGESGTAIKIRSALVYNDTIMVASEEGLLSADVNNSALFDFSNWYRYNDSNGLSDGPANHVVRFNNRFHAFANDNIVALENGSWEIVVDIEENYNIRSLSTNSNTLLICQRFDDGSSESSRLLYANEAYSTTAFMSSRAQRQEEAIIMEDGTVWLADIWSGLVRVVDGEAGVIKPNGPSTKNSFRMATSENRLLVAPGKVEENWNIILTRFGFYEFADNDWTSYTENFYGELNDIYDIIDVAIHPVSGDAFFASAPKGVLQFSSTSGMTLWDDSNSTIDLLGSAFGNYKITGLTFDYNNNLWVSNYSATDPLLLRTGDTEQWLKFKPTVSTGNKQLNEITSDIYGQVWALIHEGGVLVYNPGTDLYAVADDSYAVLKQGSGAGNLPSNNTFSITSDKDGEIWIGTDAGIAIVPCPLQVVEGTCEAFQPIVTIDGFNGPLFQSEIVRDIEVDGGNRKWIATDNGAWLLSEDGEESLEYFTEDNSPLFSNVIRDIAIDPKSGEVFFGTENGIVSYRGTSNVGTEIHSEVQVFPNPVRPEYNGEIAIRGLADDAEIKITDISGTLMYETRAQGGQAVWNGKNYNGQKAQTGVYLVFSTSEDGQDGHVAKIMFIN